MLINRIFACFVGISAGLIASGGVFALLTAIGVIPRMAGKTHTAAHVIKYENAVILGGIAGNILTIYEPKVFVGTAGGWIFGIFSGIFVGCLATSLAESLNVTAVFTRRAKIKLGIEYIVISLALGKLIGSLIYYYKGF